MNPGGSSGAQRLRTIFVLVVIVGVHAGLVFGAVHARGNIWHDEAISLLTATGHQDEWAAIERDHTAPYGAWAPAAEYRRFMEVDRPFDLQGVSRSVGDYDHHPPLFYWLLHLALVFGAPTLWAGPAVNLLVIAAVVALMFRFVVAISGSVALAAVTAAAAAWSPAMVGAVAEALPYPLLALMLVLLAVACHRIALAAGAGRALTRAESAALVAVLAGGMLTNHQFVGLSLIGLSVAWWWGRPRPHALALRLFAAWAGAAVATYLLFPYFFEHVTAVSSGAPFDPGLIAGRLSRWITRAADVILIRPSGGDSIRWGVRLVLLGAATAAVLRWRAIAAWMRSNRPAAVVVVTAVLIAVVPPVLYALQRSPEHAYGSRYAAFLWPLVLTGFAVSGIGPRRAMLGVVAAAALAFSLDWVGGNLDSGDAAQDLIATVVDADGVLVDCTSRGYFPTVAWHLDPDTSVLLATGTDLAAAIGEGLDLPPGEVVLLHASCPNPGDVLAALQGGGHSTMSIGNLERFTIYRITGLEGS